MAWLAFWTALFYLGPAAISVIYCLIKDRQEWREEEIGIQPPELLTEFETEKKAA